MVGLTTAALGAQHVTLTDQQQLLPLLQRNIQVSTVAFLMAATPVPRQCTFFDAAYRGHMCDSSQQHFDKCKLLVHSLIVIQVK